MGFFDKPTMRKRPPSPEELKLQLQGAAAGLLILLSTLRASGLLKKQEDHVFEAYKALRDGIKHEVDDERCLQILLKAAWNGSPIDAMEKTNSGEKA